MQNKIIDEIKNGQSLFTTDYIVDKKLDSGKDGTVFIVHKKANKDKLFAAKVFVKPDNVDDLYWTRVYDEIVTCTRISQKPNSNLIKVYESFMISDECFIMVMEYINGITLRSYLTQYGCLAPAVALNIFKKILLGVKQLHEYKHTIVHRDLKPDNIMVSNDLSRVVIIDFSIASVIQEDDNKILTDDTHSFGTNSYVSPDLLDPKKNKSKSKTMLVQLDFYSLGVVLYEMVMGTLPFQPFESSDPKVAQTRTINMPKTYDIINISANPTIPPSLENIIYRCLVCKPQEIVHRYNSVDEIIADVDRCLLKIDQKHDDTPLLKPVHLRYYQKDNLIKTDILKSNQKWYHQWYAFLILFAGLLAIIIVLIIYFAI